MSDLYICGTCSTQYTNLDLFLEHKGAGCSLSSRRTNITKPISPLKIHSNQVCTATNGLNVGGSSLTQRLGPNSLPDHKAAGSISTSPSVTPNVLSSMSSGSIVFPDASGTGQPVLYRVLLQSVGRQSNDSSNISVSSTLQGSTASQMVLSGIEPLQEIACNKTTSNTGPFTEVSVMTSARDASAPYQSSWEIDTNKLLPKTIENRQTNESNLTVVGQHTSTIPKNHINLLDKEQLGDFILLPLNSPIYKGPENIVFDQSAPVYGLASSYRNFVPITSLPSTEIPISSWRNAGLNRSSVSNISGISNSVMISSPTSTVDKRGCDNFAIPKTVVNSLSSGEFSHFSFDHSPVVISNANNMSESSLPQISLPHQSFLPTTQLYTSRAPSLISTQAVSSPTTVLPSTCLLSVCTNHQNLSLSPSQSLSTSVSATALAESPDVCCSLFQNGIVYSSTGNGGPALITLSNGIRFPSSDNPIQDLPMQMKEESASNGANAYSLLHLVPSNWAQSQQQSPVAVVCPVKAVTAPSSGCTNTPTIDTCPGVRLSDIQQSPSSSSAAESNNTDLHSEETDVATFLASQLASQQQTGSTLHGLRHCYEFPPRASAAPASSCSPPSASSQVTSSSMNTPLSSGIATRITTASVPARPRPLISPAHICGTRTPITAAAHSSQSFSANSLSQPTSSPPQPFSSSPDRLLETPSIILSSEPLLGQTMGDEAWVEVSPNQLMSPTEDDKTRLKALLPRQIIDNISWNVVGKHNHAAVASGQRGGSNLRKFASSTEGHPDHRTSPGSSFRCRASSPQQQLPKVSLSGPKRTAQSSVQTIKTEATVICDDKTSPKSNKLIKAVQRLCCGFIGCAFSTPYRKDLVRHSRKHTGELPYSCDECSKRFSRRDKLVCHGRTHRSERPHPCPHHGCSYAAITADALRKHVRTHTNERPYRCQLCSYCAKDGSQLVVHIRKHTGDAPFTCLVRECGSSFRTSSDLKRHQSVHRDPRPLSCRLCSFTAPSKSGMRSHLRSAHQPDAGPPKASPNTTKSRDLAADKCPLPDDIKCSLLQSSPDVNRSSQFGATDISDCDDQVFEGKQTLKLENIKNVEKSNDGDWKDGTHHKPDSQTEMAVGRATVARRYSRGGHFKMGARNRRGGRAAWSSNYLKNHKCAECPMSFVRSDSLRSHVRVHERHRTLELRTVVVREGAMCEEEEEEGVVCNDEGAGHEDDLQHMDEEDYEIRPVMSTVCSISH